MIATRQKFPVDIDNLNSMESKIYNLSDRDWRVVEDEVLEKFPKRVW